MSSAPHEDIAELLSVVAGGLEDLAEEVGVSYASLHAWASGRRRPSPANARALAQVVLRRTQRARSLSLKLWGYGIESGSRSFILQEARQTREHARLLREDAQKNAARARRALERMRREMERPTDSAP